MTLNSQLFLDLISTQLEWSRVISSDLDLKCDSHRSDTADRLLTNHRMPKQTSRTAAPSLLSDKWRMPCSSCDPHLTAPVRAYPSLSAPIRAYPRLNNTFFHQRSSPEINLVILESLLFCLLLPPSPQRAVEVSVANRNGALG